MNARNYLYIYPFNSAEAKKNADDKLETKKILLKHNISTPNLYAKFESRAAIQSFDWNTLPENGFVIKPARGFAGGGILPIRKMKDGIATSVMGDELTIEQLQSHTSDILDGGYSLQFLPDNAFIEERLIPHPFFRKLGAIGIPDIRVIVFHSIPVMAMMRFPTEESGGKANVTLGAIAFGIDMRTGITVGAYSKKGKITTIPGTKIKVRGIRIPMWEEILLLAARTQTACKLGYAGIDIVLDKRDVAFVLEVNARPGLAIQNANNDSLRTRLERIENIPVPSPERGVEVSKSLFAQSFSEKVKQDPVVLTVVQPVTLTGNGKSIEVEAKLDTGAYRTSIDKKLAEELDLKPTGEFVTVTSASGETKRPLYKATFMLGGKKVVSTCSVIDRSKMNFPVIVGRLDLKGFLINPVFHEENPEKEEQLENG